MDTEKKITEMENKISDLERKLKAALRQDDEQDVPTPIRGSLVSTFRGEMMKFAIMTWAWLIVFVFCAVGCFMAFEAAESTKSQLMFMAFFIISIMGTVLIKLWYWQVWNRYSVVREVKRLELRIAELTEKLEKQ